MMLVELGSVPSEALPIAELRDHMRLGSGFADDGSQNELMEAYLRSALSAIETRIGKAIFERMFSWSVMRWSDCTRLGLPVAPVASITSLKLVAADGGEQIIEPERYVLKNDTQRPQIFATTGIFPTIPSHGHAEIEFVAGYGPDWADVPAALRHAILLQATHFHECRSGGGGGEKMQMPMGVMALIEGFRPVRLGGGGA